MIAPDAGIAGQRGELLGSEKIRARQDGSDSGGGVLVWGSGLETFLGPGKPV
jgi:hypothetical protein